MNGASHRMEICLASDAEFLEIQESFSSSNFLQSLPIFNLQTERNRYLAVEKVIILEQGQVVGLAVINYVRLWRFFKKAIVVQGPVLQFANHEQTVACLQILEKHVQKNGALCLMCHPFLAASSKGVKLEDLTLQQNQAVASAFAAQNYTHFFSPDYLLDGANQEFIKDLRDFASCAAIEASYDAPLRRNLKKYRDSHVKVRQLTLEEIPLFYHILQETSKRKGFDIKDIAFFYSLKKYFNDQALFMYAYLDCPAYQAYLTKHIEVLTQDLSQLELQDDSKKRNVAIKQKRQQLNSYQKRYDDFLALKNPGTELPLSSYLFIEFGDQLLSYFGGNLDDYFIFGGATLINAEMIQYAKKRQLSYFNFGGTIETEQSSAGLGNFKFKKQFGGQLVQYLGSYTKYLNMSGKLLARILKK